MFEKRKQKKLEKLRRMEANASFVQGEKEKASENEEQAYYEKQVRRKKSMRREVIKSLLPGFGVSFLVGLAIYYVTSPLGQFMALGITVLLLIVSNVIIYVYTNRIYIPPGIDFAVYGPVDPQDSSSQQEIGMWRVPTALTGNIHKDLQVPLKFIRVIPADSSVKIKDKYTSMDFGINDINKMKVVNIGETMAYKVSNFYWDDDTGEISVSPIISYGHDNYDLQEGLMDELQVKNYHLTRANTLLKTKFSVLVEKRVWEILPDMVKRITKEKKIMYNKNDDENIKEIENEIAKEEEYLKPEGRGEE